MRSTILSLAWVLALSPAAVWAQGSVRVPTWPSSSDELEDIVFLNNGYRSRGFGNLVTPCGFSATGPGRMAAAEHIRTAFHDMATANVFSGDGGLDGSIQYELYRLENNGDGFTTTITNYAPFFGPRVSLADIIAAGMYTAVRSCGGPVIPVRYGRVDATDEGNYGVPSPGDSIDGFRGQFQRFGIQNDADMIAAVACGHTLGGVHAANFDTVVAPGTVPNDYAFMDSSHDSFDERVASEFVAGNTTNPLVVGISRRYKRDSDNKVYSADRNVTIKALSDPNTFRKTCARVLQKLIDVVPADVTLSDDPLVPYEVKPSNLKLYLLDGGNTASFSGEIRVRTTSRSAQNVQIVYKDRTGATCSGCSIPASNAGTASGFDDSFSFYRFAANISAVSSISTFSVIVDGQTFDNNGVGFPMSDTILIQYPQSCLSAPNALRVTAAIRTGTSGVPQLGVIVRDPRDYSPVPSLSTMYIALRAAPVSSVGGYTIYTATYAIDPSKSAAAKFFVNFARTSAPIVLQDVSGLPRTCASLSANDPNQPSTTATTTTTTTATTMTTTTTTTTTTITTTTTTATTAIPTTTTTSPSTSTTSTTTATTTTQIPTTTPLTNTTTTTTTTTNNATTTTTSSTNTSTTTTTAITTTQPLPTTTTTTTASTTSTTSATTTTADSTTTQSTTTTTSTTKPVTTTIKSAFTTLTTTTSTTTTKPPTSTPITKYKYLGCYYDKVSQRTFSAKSTYSANMDYDTCNTFCGPYDYFGVEYGSECFCSSVLPANTTATVAAEADCNMPCSGNSTQKCGAADRLSVFTQRDVPNAPTNPPFISPFSFKGCYTDSQSARALVERRYDDPDAMTNNKCASMCAGFSYFGTEYGAECYCGNMIANASTAAAVSDCNMVCAGDGMQYCGSADRLSLFEVPR